MPLDKIAKNNTAGLYEDNRAANRRRINDKFNVNSNEMERLLRANNIHNIINSNYYDKFNRFGWVDPQNTFKGLKEYIFFTKPDLNIFASDGENLGPCTENIPIFRRFHQTDIEILYLLQRSRKGNNSNFMALLTNAARSSLELPSIDGTALETNGTIYGDKITYRWTSIESDADHKFTIEFVEDKYLSIYKLFRAYDEYNRLKCSGRVVPPDIVKYTVGKVLHDQFSAYKILVESDGSTIVYFAKLWGVYPTGVPRDALSNLETSSTLTIPISFNASFVEDMNPMIIKDFNVAAGFYDSEGNTIRPGYLDNRMNIYDEELDAVNGDWAATPFIINSSHNLGYDKGAYGDRNKCTSWKLLWTRDLVRK